MVQRRETLKQEINARESQNSKINGKFCKWRSSEELHSPHEVSLSEPATLNSKSRRAKLLATDKIRKNVEIINGRLHPVQRLKHNRKDRICLAKGNSRKRRFESQSTSPNCNAQRSALPNHVVKSLQPGRLLSNTSQTTSSEEYTDVQITTEKKLLLKHLSIPLKKMKMGVNLGINLQNNVALLNSGGDEVTEREVRGFDLHGSKVPIILRNSVNKNKRPRSDSTVTSRTWQDSGGVTTSSGVHYNDITCGSPSVDLCSSASDEGSVSPV